MSGSIVRDTCQQAVAYITLHVATLLFFFVLLYY